VIRLPFWILSFPKIPFGFDLRRKMESAHLSIDARDPLRREYPLRVMPCHAVGNTIERAITDAGYRGHNAPPDYKFRLYTAGQKRRVTPQIKRNMKRRALPSNR
jgi:hypothetical protein